MDKSVKSAERAFVLLEHLAKSSGGLSFSELLARTDFPKSSLHGLLATLLRLRVVAFDERSRRYFMGSGLWELAMAYVHQLQIVPLAWPEVEALRDEVDETVQMGVLDGQDVVYVAKAESSHPLQLVSHVGSRLPAYATAIGKALLAGLPEAEVVRRVVEEQLTVYTAHTLSTRTELLLELERIRARGWARDLGEYSPEVRCVAVPILNHRHEVVASVSVSMPADRFGEEREQQLVPGLTRCARTISEKLGAVKADAWRWQGATLPS